MPFFYFPDNTVLINFSLIDGSDILRQIVREQGRWTITVAREWGNSSQKLALPSLSNWKTIFGTPISPTRAEQVDAAHIAIQMRHPGENDPAKNIGEAETIAVIQRRGLSAFFLTDDHDAARVAKLNKINVVGTGKLIATAEAQDWITSSTAHAWLNDLWHNHGRVLGDMARIDDYDTHVANLRASHR